jgi:glycosyltransferase involved in cell wall biosynthesis
VRTVRGDDRARPHGRRGLLMDYRLSVVMSTFNRCRLLPIAIESLFVEPAPPDLFEVIVVDNGSTDATSEVVDELAAHGRPVRRIVEARKGVAYTRNAGVRASRAPFIALMDDDQEAYPGWAAAIVRTFEAHPESSFLAGPLEPNWIGDPPSWITRGIQGAVAIIEWGAATRPIDASRWMCVPGGNSAYRREVVEGLGGWRPLPRSQDREFTVRLLLNGHQGLYLPDMRMRHRIDANRANRAYFRRWNATEGRMRAAFRFEELFDADGRIHPANDSARSLGGVPLFLYRRLFTEALHFGGDLVRNRTKQAFEHELKLRYLWNYIRARVTRTAEPLKA